jgi:hypothetical protein
MLRCRFDGVETARVMTRLYASARLYVNFFQRPADDRAVFLLDECLVVLSVGTRARHLELLLAAPWDDHIVHERAIIVEVHADQQPGELALNERAIAPH